MTKRSTRGGIVWLSDPRDLVGCATASGLGDPRALIVSPDQRQVLVVGGGGEQRLSALVVLDRDADTGALRFSSCVS